MLMLLHESLIKVCQSLKDNYNFRNNYKNKNKSPTASVIVILKSFANLSSILKQSLTSLFCFGSKKISISFSHQIIPRIKQHFLGHAAVLGFLCLFFSSLFLQLLFFLISKQLLCYETQVVEVQHQNFQVIFFFFFFFSK